VNYAPFCITLAMFVSAYYKQEGQERHGNLYLLKLNIQNNLTERRDYHVRKRL
jgi:hypothetical protein